MGAIAIKKRFNGITYDFSGMKNADMLTQEGYELEATAINGSDLVTSYLAHYKGKRIYGYYDYQKARYVEELTC